MLGPSRCEFVFKAYLGFLSSCTAMYLYDRMRTLTAVLLCLLARSDDFLRWWDVMWVVLIREDRIELM